MTVYLDELFLLNAILNYLLLLTAAMLGGAPLRRGWFAMSAALGGAYACGVYFPVLAPLYTLPGKLGCAAVMSLIAYGYDGGRNFLRRTALFFVVSFAFAGAMLALFRLTGTEQVLPLSTGVLLAVAVGAYLVMTLLMRNAPRLSERAPPRTALSVTLYGTTITREAMVDTGNRLTDPLTNAPVLVMEYAALREALPREMRTVLDVCGVADAVGSLRMLAAAGCADGCRLIPYRAVGTAHGLLLAVRPEQVRVDERDVPDALVGLVEAGLSDETGCPAVTGA